MRVKLGIIIPVIIQVGITFLYSSIRYNEIQQSLVTALVLLLFPVIVIYVLAPQLTSFITRLETKIEKKIEDELVKLILTNDANEYTESRTQLIENKLPTGDKINLIGQSITEKLVPLLSTRAVDFYKDTYYSRDNKLTQEKSLVYFEALILFSSLTGFFLLLDLILVRIMSYTTIPFYFIELDEISNQDISLNLTILLIVGIIFTVFIFRYSVNRFMYYLPYVIPVLFAEPKDEQYIRRETIRSLIDYNMDNLIDRRDQRKVGKISQETLEDLLRPLLRDEILITARTEFAQKLAWREYSRQIQPSIIDDKVGKESYLERLVLGDTVGSIKLDDKDLLGLHSDLEYVNTKIQNWGSLSQEVRAFSYFQLFRVVENIMKEISVSLGHHNLDEEYNLYNGITKLYETEFLDEDGKTELHNLRYRRNKLMHEPGVSLDVTRESIEKIIDSINKILEKLVLTESHE